MSLFNDLMTKIFSHSGSTAGASTAPASTATAQQTQTPTAAKSAPSSPAAAAPQVDITATLDSLAAKNQEKLDWRDSIVDLMKLVGMDSSLAARKQLATELHYTGNQKDTGSMNVWLHKEVLRKLAQNGGKVPQELLS